MSGGAVQTGPQLTVVIEIDLRVGARRDDLVHEREAIRRARHAAAGLAWVKPGDAVVLLVDGTYPQMEVVDQVLQNIHHLGPITLQHPDPEGADRWLRALRGEDIYGLAG